MKAISTNVPKQRNKQSLTICLVIHDEAKLLPRCLASVKKLKADLFVLHDGPCSDDSLKICTQYGAKIAVRPFIGEAEPHRVWMYEHCATEWILQLDADEYLSSELQQELPSLLANAHIDCVDFVWPYWNGKRYLTSGWPRKKALFRRNTVQFVGVPHEEVRVNPLRLFHSLSRLHHQPDYDNLTFARFRTKGRQWIAIHAQYLLRPADQLERFPRTSQTLPAFWECRQAPFLLAFPKSLYIGLASFASGGFRFGLTGVRIAFFIWLYYFLLFVEVAWRKHFHRSLVVST